MGIDRTYEDFDNFYTDKNNDDRMEVTRATVRLAGVDTVFPDVSSEWDAPDNVAKVKMKPSGIPPSRRFHLAGDTIKEDGYTEE